MATPARLVGLAHLGDVFFLQKILVMLPKLYLKTLNSKVDSFLKIRRR